jgi:hypothetical protein
MRGSLSVADRPLDRAHYCSQCGQPVVVARAHFCKQCGAPLNGPAVIARDLSWRPLIAAALSVIPGLGHVYKGRPIVGALWFIGILMAYHTNQFLGFVLHFVCAGNAALSGAVREDAVFARLGRRRRASSRRRRR